MRNALLRGALVAHLLLPSEGLQPCRTVLTVRFPSMLQGT